MIALKHSSRKRMELYQAAPPSIPLEFDITLHINLLDVEELADTINKFNCYEFYHLHAISSVNDCNKDVSGSLIINGVMPIKVAEACLQSRLGTKLFNASSSEIFGNNTDLDGFQRESTNYMPNNVYGLGKLTALDGLRKLRKASGLFCANGILFNHESILRSDKFVTKKICRSVAEIKMGKRQYLELGNINVKRDWGWAPEYVDAMWRTLQAQKANDYIIASGTTLSLSTFLEIACSHAGITDWQPFIIYSNSLAREDDTIGAPGDASTALSELGWKATIPPETWIGNMIDHELSKL